MSSNGKDLRPREAGPDDVKCHGPACTRAAVQSGMCWAHYSQLHTPKRRQPVLKPLRTAHHDGHRVQYVTRPCSYCGKAVTRQPSLMASEHAYCNRDHQYAHRRSMDDYPTCSVAGCDAKAIHKTSRKIPVMCQLHYGRAANSGRKIEGVRCWTRQPREVTCYECGRAFVRPFNTTAKKFCSPECFGDWRAKEAPARWLDKRGYVWLRISKMPAERREFARLCASNAQSMVMEHRLVMAEAIGRPLQRSEEVHHGNGVKTDNRLVNLNILARGDHQKYHADVNAELRKLRHENEKLKRQLEVERAGQLALVS